MHTHIYICMIFNMTIITCHLLSISILRALGASMDGSIALNRGRFPFEFPIETRTEFDVPKR